MLRGHNRSYANGPRVDDAPLGYSESPETAVLGGARPATAFPFKLGKAVHSSGGIAS